MSSPPITSTSCSCTASRDLNGTEHMQPYMEVLSDEKAKGRVRAVGCSCHDFQAMQTAAVTPWVDVILARINMKGGKEVMMDGSRDEVEDVLRTAKANGKAIIGMKIFGEGRLADQRDACMKYAQKPGPHRRDDDRFPHTGANRRRAAADAQIPGQSSRVSVG